MTAEGSEGEREKESKRAQRRVYLLLALYFLFFFLCLFVFLISFQSSLSIRLVELNAMIDRIIDEGMKVDCGKAGRKERKGGGAVKTNGSHDRPRETC